MPCGSKLGKKNSKFYLCVAYWKPNKAISYVLQTNLNTVKEFAGSKVILTGDLNADPNMVDGQDLSNDAKVNGLFIHITEPPRITPASKTILDQFLSNMHQMIKSVFVSAPVGMSNHCTIEAKLHFRRKKGQSYT